MGNHLQDQAIAAALNQNWAVAIALNQDCLQFHPTDIPTLNRLAKAYKEMGQIEAAIDTYKTVLSLDKYNVIAKKNIDILIKNPPATNKPPSQRKISTEFIKEPGKTKTYCLTRLGDPQIVANLLPGQVVHLVAKKHTFCLFTDAKEHIGALTDDIAFELKPYIVQGTQFEAVIKSATPSAVVIFVRQLPSPTNPETAYWL
ncbi:hypothetical protein A2W24_04550 [Microgenomates group bacterium RBG_16_45_19]|nr:MAG: hypothetical protein A2W24_04550 [Microgenomates group bacterium RBG_16_45_19]